ncbi:MAG: methanogenesis marker 15 protein, partial [Candidatus Kryptoniota bacterium]
MKMARKIRIAQISCGTEYSGIQKEIEKAAEIVGGMIIIPEVDLNEIRTIEDELGFHVASPGLKVM